MPWTIQGMSLGHWMFVAITFQTPRGGPSERVSAASPGRSGRSPVLTVNEEAT